MEFFCKLEFSSDFLNMMTTTTTKEKINIERKFLRSTYLIRNLSLEYIQRGPTTQK